MTDPVEAIPGQHDVHEILELVVRDQRSPTTSVHGELVGAASELVEQFVLTLVASPQTQRTYKRACGAFAAWLGPLAGPEHLTAANVAAYHAQLVAGGLASSTVKKERAAINSFLRWLVDFDHIPTVQARAALAVKLPRAQQLAREAPKALTGAQYDALLQAARAAIADEPLAGARDLAMLLVLGDAGLRCEELAGLDRDDFKAARAGAQLRTLDVRHGKGDRGRVVTLSRTATRAIVRWERERARLLGPTADDGPLFITLGRRRRDGTHVGVGARCGQPVLAAVMKRLGHAARMPAELRHAHALRHTCATELLRSGANLADVRTMLGHVSIKTTSIYLAWILR